jgi:hypothetical protein
MEKKKLIELFVICIIISRAILVSGFEISKLLFEYLGRPVV